jgi:hypothetical protein
MSGTVLENPLVQFYLRRLDAACIALPVASARELRDQIAAHLDESLPPGATDAQVRAELARLGTPAALAAEIAGPAHRSAGARLRGRLARLRWWAWASIATVFAVLAAAVAYTILVTTAAPLSYDGGEGWWYPQDGAAQVQTTADGVSQTTVPERFGQQQGFFIGLDNDSDWTQTILGVDPGRQAGSMFMTVAGASFGTDHGWSWNDEMRRWIRPAVIPPHSNRYIRVLWTSNACNSPGAQTIVDDLWLRVRVGVYTRTEDIPLGRGWAIEGTKTSSPANACG